MANAVEMVKKAAVEAVEAGKPVQLLFGTVISVSPLKIQADQKSVYTERMLVLTRHVTDYQFDMTVSHQTEAETGHVHSINAETAHTHAIQDTYTGGGTSSPTSHTHTEQPTTHLHAYTGRKTFTVHNGLVVGDVVLLARMQHGKRFVVLDRIGGP